MLSIIDLYVYDVCSKKFLYVINDEQLWNNIWYEMMYAICNVCPMYEYDVYANVYVMIMFMIICVVKWIWWFCMWCNYWMIMCHVSMKFIVYWWNMYDDFGFYEMYVYVKWCEYDMSIYVFEIMWWWYFSMFNCVFEIFVMCTYLSMNDLYLFVHDWCLWWFDDMAWWWWWMMYCIICIVYENVLWL